METSTVRSPVRVSCVGSGGVECGTLLGPEGAALCWFFPSVPGSGLALYRLHVVCGAGGRRGGLGFGGVFVNWIVDASI